jgi:hypothetical protein
MNFCSLPYVLHSPPSSFSMLGTRMRTAFVKRQLQSLLGGFAVKEQYVVCTVVRV